MNAILNLKTLGLGFWILAGAIFMAAEYKTDRDLFSANFMGDPESDSSPGFRPSKPSGSGTTLANRVLASSKRGKIPLQYVAFDEYNQNFDKIFGKWKIYRLTNQYNDVFEKKNKLDKQSLVLGKILKVELIGTSKVKAYFFGEKDKTIVYRIAHLTEWNTMALVRKVESDNPERDSMGFEILEMEKIGAGLKKRPVKKKALSLPKVANKTISKSSVYKTALNDKASNNEEEKEAFVGDKTLHLYKAFSPKWKSKTFGTLEVRGSMGLMGGNTIDGLKVEIYVNGKDEDPVEIVIDHAELLNNVQFKVEVDGHMISGVLITQGPEDYQVRLYTGPDHGAVLSFGSEKVYNRYHQQEKDHQEKSKAASEAEYINAKMDMVNAALERSKISMSDYDKMMKIKTKEKARQLIMKRGFNFGPTKKIGKKRDLASRPM